jgi:predicted site-specific integrase-resolvase
MKLSEYAKKYSLTYVSVYNHYRKGLIPGAFQMPSGTIIVPDEVNKEFLYPNKIVIYARVSSPGQKDDLDRQAERLNMFAMAKGYSIYKIIKETASGLNENREKLNSILQDKNYSILLVEHKDRLTRFGFQYIKMLFDEQKRTIEIVNEEEEKSDLIQDFVSVITSFCARIYGQRKGKRKTEIIIRELNNENI